LAASYGIRARADFEQYILQGIPIVLASNALGPAYELREAALPSFDPGFSVGDTFKTHKVTGVVENGAAYRAGLREGMNLMRIENYNRFGNAWSPNKPMIVVVKINDRDQAIEFFPHGTPMRLMPYQRRSKSVWRTRSGASPRVASTVTRTRANSDAPLYCARPGREALI
jgi:predicted metalloprotease with PDZ domain